jgi:hypothetical protein
MGNSLARRWSGQTDRSIPSLHDARICEPQLRRRPELDLLGDRRDALAAGVLDELELHVIPVLFGAGRRLFEGLPAEQIELERTRVLVGDGGVTHLHYRVRR